MIAFFGAPYEVKETDRIARVFVGVASGRLIREVVMEFSFSDGSAICKYNHLLSHHMTTGCYGSYMTCVV